MNSILTRLFLIVSLFLVSIIALAAPTPWEIVPNESSITFTATQNNSPVTGEFKSFKGEIFFDPAQLDNSQAKIIVDMNSVSTSYQDVADTLKTTSWFDIKNFPQAIFVAKHFVKTGNNTFQADGDLTIRNKTVPTTLTFTLEKYADKQALVKGTATLKRTPFEVGTGEWADTTSIKDDVIVNFILSAKH